MSPIKQQDARKIIDDLIAKHKDNPQLAHLVGELERILALKPEREKADDPSKPIWIATLIEWSEEQNRYIKVGELKRFPDMKAPGVKYRYSKAPKMKSIVAPRSANLWTGSQSDDAVLAGGIRLHSAATLHREAKGKQIRDRDLKKSQRNELTDLRESQLREHCPENQQQHKIDERREVAARARRRTKVERTIKRIA